jgi:hypothetical protein
MKEMGKMILTDRLMFFVAMFGFALSALSLPHVLGLLLCLFFVGSAEFWMFNLSCDVNREAS